MGNTPDITTEEPASGTGPGAGVLDPVVTAGAGDGARRRGTHFGPRTRRAWGWAGSFTRRVATVADQEHTVWEAVVIFVASFVLTALWYHHAWVHPTTLQVGIPGDADEYDWFLGWVPWALVHGHDPLVSTYVNSAHGVNLMWNTSVILPGLVMSPFTAIFGAPFSYNLLITLAPALDTMLAYLAFRRWCGRLPSLAGALLFAYCPYVAVQAPGHLAQVLMMSLPLLLVLGDRLFVVQRGRAWLDGLFVGLVLWAQLLTSEELLAMEAVVGAVALVVLAVANRHVVRDKVAYALRGAGVAVGCFIVLGLPFLAIQFRGPYRVEGVHPGNAYVTDLLNFIVPTGVTRLAPHWALNISSHFIAGEDGSYLGIPLVLLVLVAVIAAWRRKVLWVALAITLSAAIFSMGSTVHYYGHNSHIRLPGAWLERAPHMKNLLPARFAAVTDFGAGFLSALALSQLARARWVLRAGAWLLALAALAFIFPLDNYPASVAPKYPAFTTGWACPQAPSAGHGGRPPVALMMPTANELDLLWQEEAHFCFAMPTARGMTGTASITTEVPPVLAGGIGAIPLPTVTPTVRQQFAQALRSLHVQEVIVAPENPTSPGWEPAQQAQMVAWLTTLLGRPPAQYVESYYTYAWQHLPPFNDIATGHFPATSSQPATSG